MIVIPDEIKNKAEKQYRDTMTEENRALRDDRITPFGISLDLMGYKKVVRIGGCVDLMRCCECGESGAKAKEIVKVRK